MMNICELLSFFFVYHLILPQTAQAFNYETKHQLQVKNGLCTSRRVIISTFFNEINGSSIAFGNWKYEDIFLLTIIQSVSRSFYLFDTKSNNLHKYKRFPPFTKINKTVAETKVYPVSNVIIMLSSSAMLMNLLNDFKGSIWWNHEAKFVIINNNYEKGCHFAHKFLKIVWKFNILSAIYLCIHKESKMFMYTFNPYDRVGTAFWQIDWANIPTDDYWTLLQHSFDDFRSSNDFNDLNFERLKNLNRLNINIGTRELKLELPPGPVLREVANHAEIVYAVLDKLNATYTLKRYPYVGANAKTGPTGLLKDVESGSLKVAALVLAVRAFWKLQSYPREFKSVGFVTPKNSHDLHYFTELAVRNWPFFAVPVLLLITIKYTIHYSMSRTLLEIVRLLTSGTILHKFTPSRKHFVFIIFITIISTNNSYFQSLITAHNTVPNEENQIDSWEDLINSNLSLVGIEAHEEFLYRKEILKRYQIGNVTECIYDIQFNGQKKACVIDCKVFGLTLASLCVHEAKEKLTIRPSAFLLSSDWPLYSKFNLILNYIVAAGIYRLLSVTDQAVKWSRLNKNYVFQSQKLENFKYAFYFVSIGCTLAICTLLLEVIVHKIRKMLIFSNSN